MIKGLAQGHMHHSRSQNSNQYSYDSAIRAELIYVWWDNAIKTEVEESNKMAANESQKFSLPLKNLYMHFFVLFLYKLQQETEEEEVFHPITEHQ